MSVRVSERSAAVSARRRGSVKITQAVALLEKLRAKHGDIDVYADCPKCGESFLCGIVVTAPETARLKARTEPKAK